MILGKVISTFDAVFFLSSFTKTLNSTVRVAIDSKTRTFCTGWLLTNNIVIIAGFAASDTDNFLCYPTAKTNKLPIKATVIYKAASQQAGNNAPALLLLQKTINNPAPAFQFEKCEEEDDVAIIQYPGGQPNAQVSFGKITAVNEEFITYNADTQPGSTGSPVLNLRTGKIIGMHYQSNRDQLTNAGISIGTIIKSLRNSDHWNAISKYHNILDIGISQTESTGTPLITAWKDIHYKAALTWNFEHFNLSAAEQDALKPFIADVNSDQWILKPADRQEILGSKPLIELQKIKHLAAVNTIGQKVIDRIIQGGPYKLEDINEAELPYWLQAVRWFAVVDDHLPNSAAVNRMLQKKRVRSHLSELGGPDFKGRKKQLTTLNEWYKNPQDGPVVISGIGGIGKSALVSNFALSLSEVTPVLWLDFDRADLAADDAVSVLKILSEQIFIQVPGFLRPVITENWEHSAFLLGNSLSVPLSSLPSPLLILDGFEVAQQVKQYQEIWKLLEIIILQCPSLKIIVSGRAPVSFLTLAGKKSKPIHLEGLEPEDATAWLKAHNISKKEIAARIVKISGGIPLVLKLAAHYIDTGGRLNDLPESLPKVMIEGYLYQRILDRVIDIQLKPISREALILRRISADIIKEIMSATIPAGLTPEEVLERLSREMSLVDTNNPSGSPSPVINSQDGFLLLRPELRTATLKLLELTQELNTENPGWVKKVDQKAVDYYFKQDLNNMDNRAELIYHLLRSGNITEADKYWQTECAPSLKYAADDMPDTAAAERKWIQQKTGQVIGEVRDDIKIWELESLKQVKNLLSRGHIKSVAGLLSQRTERSENSPLLLYDAWVAWALNDITKAIAILIGSGATNTIILNEQYIFRAFLEVQKGDYLMADYLLSQIEPDFWAIRKNSTTEALALRAARVRLSVNLADELAIARVFKTHLNESGLQTGLILKDLNAGDVVLPNLSRVLEMNMIQESYGSSVKLPVTENELAFFKGTLDRLRKETNFLIDLSVKNLQELFSNTTNSKTIESLGQFAAEGDPELGKKVISLSLLAGYRWKIARETLLLYDFCKLAIHKEGEIEPLELSIIASTAAFRGQKMEVLLDGYSEPSIDSFLRRIIRNNPKSVSPPLSADRKKLLSDYMNQELETSTSQLDTGSILIGIEKELEKQSGANYNNTTNLKILSAIKGEEQVAVILYMFGPDPLEMLCRRIIGFPDNYKF